MVRNSKKAEDIRRSKHRKPDVGMVQDTSIGHRHRVPHSSRDQEGLPWLNLNPSEVFNLAEIAALRRTNYHEKRQQTPSRLRVAYLLEMAASAILP